MTGLYSGMAELLRNELDFTPSADGINAAAIRYRVRSTTENTNGTDPTSYTIVVFQEHLNTYCEINVGIGHSAFNYNSCPLSAL